jgi:D-alanyl-D-alanine dipeptidase
MTEHLFMDNMRRIGILYLLLSGLITFSCTYQNDKTQEKPLKKVEFRTDSSLVILENELREKEYVDSLKAIGLLELQELNAAIYVDLKYTTSDNFMGKRLYFRLNRALLQKDVAERLARCQEALTNYNPDFHLLVYDAVRPLHVQQDMWDSLDSIPSSRRGKFVSNPKNRSLHNFGAAVDLTICRMSGIPLDMGAGYDDIRKIAYPKLEAQFLASGQLTKIQFKNRQLLRSIMRAQGFRTIQTEWWHFNACSREEAKRKYPLVK